PPPRRGRSRPKLRYAHQGGQNPPVVVVHGTGLNEVPESYRRYIEGQVRQAYKLEGTPLRIEFRTTRNPYVRGKKEMSRFWSEHIHELDPYVPGEQPSQQELIKLNTNEHAYGPSPKVFEAIQAVLNDDLRLYPSFNADDLVAALGAHHQLAGEQVFVGNSSDEVLAHVFNGLFRRTGKALWFPDVTYSFYKTYCRFYDIDPHYVPLDDNLRIRPADYHQAQAQGAAGIIFANPNAPTGHYLELGVIEELAQKNPDIPVVVDEAYIDFGGQSADVLLAKCPNLVVIRTFSKGYALAGLRAGYALASAEIVAGLQRVKDSFNSY